MKVPSFGDNVRIADTPITREYGLAGELGVVYGFTTPSCTGIAFIGVTGGDVALNVHFSGRNESFWLVPELVEFVDHAAGTEVTLDGSGKKWVRQLDGAWAEKEITGIKRPWWKFWRNSD
ncbi:MAG TPA: hypothetical protein VKR31_11885 [Rhizomicrobium sp.]|nr:hypothetical protein [Rhizomicrobium sp.]